MAIKIKRKKNPHWRAFVKTWKDFSQNSSIHGLKYTTEPNGRGWFRMIWILITLSSFIGANVLVYTFYLDFRSNPTRLNIETDHAPLPELYFPAITICSANYVDSISTGAFIKELKLPPNVTEDTVFNYIRQVTGFRMKTDYNASDLDDLQFIIDSNRYSTVETMGHLRMDCSQLLFRCRWQMEILKCSELFKVSRTYSGSCCSFNIDQNGIKFLQKRATIHGVNGGISIIAQPIFDDAAVTANYANGVKLLIHKNNVYPSETTIEKLIPVDNEVLVRIRPTVITCSNQVRQLGIAERNCLFPEERRLQFFDEYDDENCIVECQMLSIMERCQCIPYYFIQQSNLPVCNFTKISCLVDNFDSTIVRKESPEYKCDCPSSCQNINFDVQTNAIPFSITNTTFNEFYDGIHENCTIIHVYLGSQIYRKLRRDLLTNFISLISNFGSAYSLFIGMSIVSIIEIIYFFTNELKNNLSKIEQVDNKVAMFTKRLDKIVYRPWKGERTPVLDILS